MLPMLDIWTDVFAVPGKRATGTQAGNYAVVPPGWSGKLPDGVERVASPTPYVWIIGRTQTNGPKDYDAVHKVQDGCKFTLLSQWRKAPVQVMAKIDPAGRGSGRSVAGLTCPREWRRHESQLKSSNRWRVLQAALVPEVVQTTHDP